MNHAEVTLSIDAPADLVWSVMLDLDSYGEWNPFVVRITTTTGRLPRVGDDILLHVRMPGLGTVSTRELIVTLQPPAGAGRPGTLAYAFRGPLHRAYLVRACRSQTVSQQEDGTTTYHTEESFRGLLGFATPVRAVQRGFEIHAHALKERAEALAHDDGSPQATQHR